MTVEIDREGRLHGIEEWDGALCEELAGGLTNRTWKVTLDDRTAVLKLDDSPRSEPFNSRVAEAEIQRIAAQNHLAPNVLYADEASYLTEFVDGSSWQRSCLDKPGNLELLAAALKRLHALPLTGRTFDSTVAARRYVAESGSADRALVDRSAKILQNRRLPQNLCCCHNDLVAENMITTPDLIFIDWEYACDNDPFFDLATVVEHHQLAEEQVERLLNAYFNGDGMRWREQLRAQQQLYLALLWLWMASRPDTNSDELAAVGVRLTSCS
ncbi:MAG: choline kinase family protein [Pseudomonadota bacterium]